jgi:hypothetical protein
VAPWSCDPEADGIGGERSVHLPLMRAGEELPSLALLRKPGPRGPPADRPSRGTLSPLFREAERFLALTAAELRAASRTMAFAYDTDSLPAAESSALLSAHSMVPLEGGDRQLQLCESGRAARS